MTRWSPSERARSTLTEIAEGAAQRAQTPSLRVALFDQGQIAWSHEIGSSAGQYRIGSITKTFTAVLVVRLRDEGLIDLNDRLGQHLADTPYADVSIRDLLAHRAGLTAEPSGSWWERSPGLDWEQLSTANAGEVRVGAPGARYHYSNLGYGLLGQLVARLRGREWYEVLRDELLAPLGLGETTYLPMAGAAVGTSRNPLTGELQGEPAQDTAAMAPAGQLWSTTTDLAKWAQVLAGAVPAVLSLESIREMQTVHSADVDVQHQGAYGLGLRLRWQSSGTLVGHTGSMPGFLAGLFIDPSTQFGGVLLTNCTTAIQSERVVAELLAASGHSRGPASGAMTMVSETREAVRELEGHWYWGNTEMLLVPDAAGFVLSSGTEGRAHFRRFGPDSFVGVDDYWNGELLTVVRNPDGEVSHLEVVTFILTRFPYDAKAPIPGGPPLPMS